MEGLHAGACLAPRRAHPTLLAGGWPTGDALKTKMASEPLTRWPWKSRRPTNRRPDWGRALPEVRPVGIGRGKPLGFNSPGTCILRLYRSSPPPARAAMVSLVVCRARFALRFTSGRQLHDRRDKFLAEAHFIQQIRCPVTLRQSPRILIVPH